MNANGETVSSFLGEQEGSGHGHGEEEEDEHGFETGIGGRPTITRRVDSLKDMVYQLRWEHRLELGQQLDLLLGTSHLYGPNSTGNDGDTYIGGDDFTLQWRRANDHDYPFLTWQTEFMYRHFKADSFTFLDEDETPPELVPLSARTLRDWGLYSQVLWGFKQDWGIGLRFEYANASGENVAFDEDGSEPAFVDDPRRNDPLRNERWRLSPMLEWRPFDATRVRVQYNFDHAEHLDDEGAHSVWLGLHVQWGRHTHTHR